MQAFQQQRPSAGQAAKSAREEQKEGAAFLAANKGSPA